MYTVLNPKSVLVFVGEDGGASGRGCAGREPSEACCSPPSIGDGGGTSLFISVIVDIFNLFILLLLFNFITLLMF
jgi:hypothetical protein